VLEHIKILSTAVPIVFFVIFCKKKATKELWVFFIYCILSFSFDLFLSLSIWASEHTFLVWNFFGVIENILLSYFFYIIINQRLIKVAIVLLSFFYVVFSLFHFNSNTEQFNSINGALGLVILLFLCLCYFINIMKPSSIPTNIYTPVFVIVFAMILSISSTLFLTVVSNQFTINEMQKYWNISSYANILMNLIVSSAFILFYNQHKPKPPESNFVDFTSPNDR
jgi:hypothetical protein